MSQYRLVKDPPELMALRVELRKHPELYQRAKYKSDLHDWICEIATDVGLVLDGWYTADDLKGICVKLTDMLYKRRTGLVIIS